MAATSSSITMSETTSSIFPPLSAMASHTGKVPTVQDDIQMQTSSELPVASATEQPLVRKQRSASDVCHSAPSRSSTPVPAAIHRGGQDDISIGTATTPTTPQRTNVRPSGLSLQMPPKFCSAQTPGSAAVNRVPLSPKLDSSHTYGSPASVLPRRSRGLDFSRASTNLHHSTLAGASPDSSPIVSSRGVTIPQRKSTLGPSAMGSPNASHSIFWSGSANAERPTISSSMSSVNMLDSDSSNSSDEDEDDAMTAFDRGDPMIMTPQGGRTGNPLSAPYSPTVTQSPISGAEWMNGFSPAKASLMNFQRARFRNVRSRHSSTSTSGNSSKQSPAPLSPPVLKSVETSSMSYFSKDAAMLDQIRSRRESLSLGTRDLHLSDMSDEGETKQAGVSSPSSGSLAGGSNSENGRRGVVKRPVTRRGNLLPKTKTFARIRAALFEESTPVESEVKREAEVIRQVRESEPEVPPLSPSLTATARFTAGGPLGNIGTATTTGIPETFFGQQDSPRLGKSGFWDMIDPKRYQTPPPPSQPAQSALRDVPASYPGGEALLNDPSVQTQYGGWAPALGQGQDVQRKFNKRRRGDDLDLTCFKRRAVSPAMSVQSSPVLPQATAKDHFAAGQLPKSMMHHGPLNEGAATNNNSNNNNTTPGSGHTGHVKRVGMQGMNETHEGLMKMSID